MDGSRRPQLAAVLAAGFLACVASSSLADDASYCITCKNPDQTYRCRVTGVGSRPNDALKLYCVIRTAKDGNHASCSAERNASCIGVETVYAYEGPPIPADFASDPRVLNPGVANDGGNTNQTVAEPKAEAPKSIVELTGRAVSASRKGLRNARSAITGSSSSDDQALPEPDDQALPEAEIDDQALPEVQPAPNRMQRASAAVGGFARKSYRCVFSLFRNCRGEPNEP